MTVEQEAKQLSHSEIVSLLLEKQELKSKLAAAEQTIEIFKKQIFGKTSEKRQVETDPRQLSLGESIITEVTPVIAKETIKSYQRKRCTKDFEGCVNQEGLRFGPRIPVKRIELADPKLEGFEEGKDYEVIREEVVRRLARLPFQHIVFEYVRKVVKMASTGELHTAPVPEEVLEQSTADVSFLAGMLEDKFLYHMPLYREHQRLKAEEINISRQTLTNWSQAAISLLEPIYEAQAKSVLESLVVAIDETPIKAGRKENHTMRQCYFWPVYGDKDELIFPFSPSRGGAVVREVLGEFCGTVLSDGYKVYESYCQKLETAEQAACWTHSRREFVRAQDVEPELAVKALDYIGKLYQVEEKLRLKNADWEKVLKLRILESRPIVEEFFAWLEQVLREKVLLGSNRFTQAANYVLQRKESLSVFLRNPYVPIDTNHLERALRPIPMGRKNWLFCWTEIGAKHVGIIQSLIQTCRIHGINPRTYLVDVLQRVSQTKMADVHLLTPRLWKQHFASNPMTSRVDALFNTEAF